MTTCVLSFSFEPLHIFHGVLHSSSPAVFFESWRCVHHGEAFRSLFHSHVWWCRQSGLAWELTNFLSMIHEEDKFFDEQFGLFLSYTLHESPCRWVVSLSVDTVHSFEHFCDIIEDTFYHFDPYHLDKKKLQQRRAQHEFVIDFWQHLCDLQFQALRSQMKFAYL